mgnify:CR=1 FL=1
MSDYYTNIIPVIESPEIYLSLGISSSNDIQLYSILNKSLVNLTNEQTAQVLSNNTLMSGKKEMSFKALVYSNPVIFSLIIIGLFTVVTIVFMYFGLK